MRLRFIHDMLIRHVLEHFRDLAVPVAALRRWLADHGTLFTSLPSESGLYERLRRLYGVVRPPDHYHTGFEVEAFLEQHGLRRVARRFVPLVVRLAPLYLVSAWRKDAPRAHPAGRPSPEATASHGRLPPSAKRSGISRERASATTSPTAR